MYDKSKTAIVYLGMNTKKDLLYNRDSRSLLEKSLDLLYKNYNNKFNHDVLIFYDSNFSFDKNAQNQIIKGRKQIKFIQIPDEIWNPPNNINIKDKNNWVGNYPIGYRNMCRWYGISIFKFVKKLGYDWILRLDDDSFIHSKIEYDIFKYMHDNNKIYGYRCLSYEDIKWRKNFIENILNYLSNKNIHKKYDILLKYYIQNQGKWISNKFNLIGPYTNFFITNVNNWINNDVENFLNFIDNTKGIYIYRWGDLIIHTAVINIFFNYKTHHHFTDFEYEHGTYNNKNKMVIGGFFPIINNNNVLKTSNLLLYEKLFGKSLHYGCFHYLNLHKHNNLCIKFINCPKELLNNSQLKNNFIIDSNNRIYYLGTFKNYNDVINCINIYNINSDTKINMTFKYNKNVKYIWFKDTTYKLFTIINTKNFVYNPSCKIMSIAINNNTIL